METWSHKINFGKVGDKWAGYGKHAHQSGMICTIAQSGAGKTTSSLIPACLTFSGSMFVIDPKGELYRETAARRRSQGQAVYCFDPFGVTGDEAATFNPLDMLDPEKDDAITESLRLTKTLIEQPKEAGENKHFYDEASALLRAVILHIRTASEYEGRRHLGTVNEMLSNINDLLFEMELSSKCSGVISRTAKRFRNKEERERSSCISTAQSNLTEIFDDPRVVKSLSSSSFDFADLKLSAIGEGKGSTVYVVIPEHYLGAYGRLLRLIVNSAMEAMYKTKDPMNPDRLKPRTPVLFLLEEFAHLGKLDALESGAGIARGSEVRLWIVLQNLSQIERNYGKHAVETFIANTGALEAFGINDNETAEYLSKKIGNHVETRITKSKVTGDNQSQSMTGVTEGQNTSVTEAQTHTVEPLFQPNHVTQGKQKNFDASRDKLLFVPARAPLIVEKVPFFTNLTLHELSASGQR